MKIKDFINETKDLTKIITNLYKTNISFSALNTNQIKIFDKIKPEELQSYITQIQAIKASSQGLYAPTPVNEYAAAIQGLEAKQAALLLSTQGLTNAQIAETLAVNESNVAKNYQAMADAGLLASKQKLTVAQVQENLQTVLGSEADAKAAMASMGLSASTETQMHKTIKLSAAKLQEAVNTNVLTEAQAQELAMRTGVILSMNAQTAGTLPKWIAMLQAATKAVWGQVKATAVWLATTPAGWATAAIAAIGTLTLGLNKLAKAEKEASDKAQEAYERSRERVQSNKEEAGSLDELIRKYEELKSASDIDSDTRNEIRELQYDIVELVGSEAQTLDLVNGKLDEQLEKLRSISEEKSRQNVEDARDTYDNARYLSDVMVGDADDYGNDVSVKWQMEATQIHKVEGFEKSTYDNFVKFLEDNGFGDIFRKNYNETLFDMRFVVDTTDIKDLESKIARLEELKEFLASSGLRNTGLYQDINDAIDRYSGQNDSEMEAANNLIDVVVDHLSVSDEKLKEIAVDSVKDFEEYRQKMIDAVKSDEGIGQILADGVLSDESIEKAVNDFMATAGQFSDWYVQWKDEMEGNTVTSDIEVSLSISDTVTQLNTQLKPTFDSLKSAYNDIFTSDGFALNSIDILSTCDSIKSKLDELNKMEGITVDYSSYEDFVRILSNTESTEQDVEIAFDSLATSITQAALTGKEDFSTMKSALEDLGVLNNEIVAFDALISNTEALKEAGLDLADATDEQITAFANETVSAANVSQAIAMLSYQKTLCNDQGMNTAGEVANLKTLAENAGYTGEVIQYLTELEQIYQEVASGTINPAVIGAKIVRAAQLQTLIQGAAAKIDYKPIEKSAAKAGSSAGKSYADALKDELSNLNSVISYIGDVIDDQIDLFEEQKDAAVDALEAEKEAAEEALEAEKELVQEKIDAKQAEIDAIEDAAKARKNELDLQKAQYDLERMQNQKTMLVNYMPDTIVI